MAIEPYADTALNDNNGNVSPTIEVVLAVVPDGKLLVVEHISGQLAVREGAVVNFISAAAQGQNSVAFLPVHFCIRCVPIQHYARPRSISSIRLTGQALRPRGEEPCCVRRIIENGGQPRPTRDNLVVRFRYRVFGRRVSVDRGTYRRARQT